MFEVNSQNEDNYIKLAPKEVPQKYLLGMLFLFLKTISLRKSDYHSYWDKWMDKIFVKYLENNSKSDEIFMKMAKKLSGEEFGSFMMGNAKFSTKLKQSLQCQRLVF